MKRKALGVLVALTLTIMMVPGAVFAEELKPTTLTWVAGGVGGGWYV